MSSYKAVIQLQIKDKYEDNVSVTNIDNAVFLAIEQVLADAGYIMLGYASAVIETEEK